MSLIINEQKMLEENIFQFEKKLKSPTSRFIDSTPTFVTYYHINNSETTTDAGFKDVSSILGFRSPIKFNKIDNLPLYGIEQIVLSIQDDDQGLDTDFSGEATVIAGTIKPLQNDYFVIRYLNDSYIFRVTDISYDSVMADSFYKISYILDFIDDEMYEQLNKQVSEDYNCILENIGSEEKCIIRTETFDSIQSIKKMYRNMVTTYLSIFYDERYNCVLGDFYNGLRLYDPYMTEFINRNRLFNDKNDLHSVILTNQIEDKFYRLKYEKSVYRFIEKQDIDHIWAFKFSHFKGTMRRESAFYRWSDPTIEIVDIVDSRQENSINLFKDSIDIFSEDFISFIKNDEKNEKENEYRDIIKKFIKKEEISLSELNGGLDEELMNFNDSIEVFFFTPIILYIIKKTIESNIEKK